MNHPHTERKEEKKQERKQKSIEIARLYLYLQEPKLSPFPSISDRSNVIIIVDPKLVGISQ